MTPSRFLADPVSPNPPCVKKHQYQQPLRPLSMSPITLHHKLKMHLRQAPPCSLCMFRFSSSPRTLAVYQNPATSDNDHGLFNIHHTSRGLIRPSVVADRTQLDLSRIPFAPHVYGYRFFKLSPKLQGQSSNYIPGPYHRVHTVFVKKCSSNFNTPPVYGVPW